jgi:hypothetical protein
LDLADEVPKGFRWSCCNGPGDEEACTNGPHKLDEKFKPEVKKRRVWDDICCILSFVRVCMFIRLVALKLLKSRESKAFNILQIVK